LRSVPGTFHRTDLNFKEYKPYSPRFDFGKERMRTHACYGRGSQAQLVALLAVISSDCCEKIIGDREGLPRLLFKTKGTAAQIQLMVVFVDAAPEVRCDVTPQMPAILVGFHDAGLTQNPQMLGGVVL
jgi:hypothetical protein